MMLPPPTTMASWTPALLMRLICSAKCVSSRTLIPVPAPPPIASPLSFKSTRRAVLVGVAAELMMNGPLNGVSRRGRTLHRRGRRLDRLPDRPTGEARDGYVFLDRADLLGQHVLHRLGWIADER